MAGETKVAQALKGLKAAKTGIEASADKMVTVAGHVADATAKMDALTAQLESNELKDAEELLREFGSNFAPVEPEVAPAKKGIWK